MHKIVTIIWLCFCSVACTSQPDQAHSDDEFGAPKPVIPVVTDSERGPVYTGVTGNVAVGGYDVVTYFEGEDPPAKGVENHAVIYNGVLYYFLSEQNAEKFQENPARFTPAYGGHCAWAMANGRLAPGDPLLYKVVDGVLYLNFNRDVQTLWLKDISGYIVKSESEWKNIDPSARFDD